MRVAAGLAAFFLAAGVSAVAQYAPLPTNTMVQGCPVDMRVRQRMGGATVEVDSNGVKRNVFAQRLRLILNSLRHDDAGRNAVSAMVTVFGTGPKARMQSLPPESAQNSMVRPFKVDLAHWGDPGVSGEFLLPGYTSASRVDLESITYDDGTTWKVKKNEGCRVAPDPLMLINR